MRFKPRGVMHPIPLFMLVTLVTLVTRCAPSSSFTIDDSTSRATSPSPSTSFSPSSSFYLPDDVTVSRRVRESKIDVPQIVLGSTAELTCGPIHDKSVPVEMSWEFNHKPIRFTNRVTKSADGTLRIEQVRNTDVGFYTCRSTTPHSVNYKTVRLDVIELPHSPLNVKTELNVAGGLVNVSWTPPFDGNSPIVRYIVEKKIVRSGSGDSSGDLGFHDALQGWTRYPANISASQRFALLTNLAPALTHQFRVIAANTVGEGPPSAASDPPITLPAQPPSAPPIGVVGGARSSTSIIIQWQPPPNEAHNGPLNGYIVRYKLAGYLDTQWYYTNVTNPGQFSCLLDDLIVWRNYEIQVGAYNEMGTGVFSPSIFIRTREGKPASPPTNVKAQPINSTSILITWNQTDPQLINGFNLGYKVQAFVFDDRKRVRVMKKEMQVTPHSTQDRGQDMVITELEPYTKYEIQVTCFTSAGDGPSNDPPVQVTTNEDLPEAVGHFTSSEITDSSIGLAWSEPEKVNGQLMGYHLRFCSVASCAEDEKTVNLDPEVNITVVKNLKPDTKYKFTINAVTRIGSGPSVTESFKSSVAPVEIGDLKFSDITMTRLKVTWDAPVGMINHTILVGYQVVYETRDDFGKQVKQRIIENSIIISGLKEKATYTFRVRAETNSGLGPEKMGVITTGPQPGSPSPPVNVTLTQTLTSVRLKWNHPEDRDHPHHGHQDIVGYLIEGKQEPLTSFDEMDTIQWSPIVSLRNGPQTEYDLSFNHLSPSSKYILRLMSVNSKGISDPSFPAISGSLGPLSKASTVIITPSHLAQLRARLPFYKEPWFVILCACMTIVVTIMVVAVLCVQSKSYQYKQEAVNKSSTGSRDALSDAVFGLEDMEGPYASGLELRSNNHTIRRSNGALAEQAAAVTSTRPPPRPTPGSLSYSDEEDLDYCDPDTKESHLYGSSNESLTEKPSELSSTGPDSESDPDDHGAQFMNHYANVNDTLRKGSNWRRQGHQYTVRPPTMDRERDRMDRDRELRDRDRRGEASCSRLALPNRPAPPVPPAPSSVTGSSVPGPPPPSYMSAVDASEGAVGGYAPGPSDMVTTHPMGNSSGNGGTNSGSTHTLNGGRIIMNNMAGSRAPLPGFSSFV